MSRTDIQRHLASSALAAGLFLVIVFAQYRTGQILIEVYGVDTLFVLDVLARVELGEVPHVDFTLPIGALPFAAMSGLGGPILNGILIGQWVLTAALFLAGFWVAVTRLTPLASLVFLSAIVIVGTSLNTTFDDRITLALIYNTWAWVIAIVFIVAIACAPQAGTRIAMDAALVGTLATVLLLTKITFFVALVPVGVLLYIAAGRWWDIGVAALTSLGLCLLVALWAGWGFWPAYAENLLWVSDNPIRILPGKSIPELIAAPHLLAFNVALAALILVVFLRDGALQGAIYLCAGLGVLFIQSQNFGNAPVWIMPVAALATTWAARVPKGVLRQLLQATAVASIALSLFLAFPMARSTIRNANLKTAEATELMPGVPGMQGLRIAPFQVAPIVEDLRPLGPNAPPHMSTCFVTEGFLGMYRTVSKALASLDEPVFVADAQSFYWLQNGNVPLRGAAPWNYGSLRGLENARLVAIPDCPFKPSYQREILRNFDRQGIVLTEIERRDRVRLMTWERPAP